MHKLYHDEEIQGRIIKELHKPFKEIKLKNYKDLHDRIKDAYKANDKEPLSDFEAEEHLKDLVNEIFPDLKYGVKGEREQNYTTFQAYLSDLKNKVGDDADKLIGELYTAVKTGKGQKATKTIVDILKQHKTHSYTGNLLTAILNPEDHEFQEAYAGQIKKETEDEIPEEEVRRYLIQKNLVEAAQKAAIGDYLGIVEKYRVKKKPAEGHSAAHATHH